MRKRKAGLEVKERHGQTCVPGALLVRVDTIQAALSLVSLLPHADTVVCACTSCDVPNRHDLYKYDVGYIHISTVSCVLLGDYCDIFNA